VSVDRDRTRSQDRLSGEFAVDKGRTGRLRGASFAADSRLTRDDSPQTPTSPLSLSSSGDVALIRHEEVPPLAVCVLCVVCRARVCRRACRARSAKWGGGQVYMEGWLNRIGADRRWFVLTANTFAYFRDEVRYRVCRACRATSRGL
jgi:hypothetical protein